MDNNLIWVNKMIHGLNLSAETSLFQTKITEVYVKNQIINHIYRILE